MDHSKKKQPSAKAMTRGGMLLALGICVVVVGGLVTAGMTGDLTPPDQTAPSTAANQAVENKATRVPDTRPITTTTTRRTTTTTATKATVSADKEPLLVLPMGNQLLQSFSNGRPVYSETMADFRVHNGADFAGDAGAEVSAVSTGEVTSIKEDALWGTVLTMDHGHGITSTYCGITPQVKVGESVKVGDPIGTLNDIPCELMGGPHLHLEIAINGEAVDPVEAIGKPVSLVTSTVTTTKK